MIALNGSIVELWEVLLVHLGSVLADDPVEPTLEQTTKSARAKLIPSWLVNCCVGLSGYWHAWPYDDVLPYFWRGEHNILNGLGFDCCLVIKLFWIQKEICNNCFCEGICWVQWIIICMGAGEVHRNLDYIFSERDDADDACTYFKMCNVLLSLLIVENSNKNIMWYVILNNHFGKKSCYMIIVCLIQIYKL